MHRLQEVVRLHRLGVSVRRAARALGMGRNTLRRYHQVLGAAGLLAGSPEDLPPLERLRAVVEERQAAPVPAQERSSIASWRPRVEALLAKGAGPTAIWDRLRLEDPDFRGSLSAVKRLCQRIQRDRGPRPEDVAIPVETDPGEVAQVDFGYAGRFYDEEVGVLRRAWAFVLVLGYSRHMHAELVFDQKVATWLELHVAAFTALGGVPAVLVPDNLKAAVVRAAFGIDGDPALHRSYRELARHYGCRIEPTPPGQPCKKGKVEAGVKYLRRNFLATLDTQDIAAARRQLQRWLVEVAGQRIHGTTGRRPLEVFAAEEKPALRPLPRRPFELVVWKRARVHRDSHVQVDGAFYSVPWRLLHQEVWARCTPASISLYHEDRRLCTHGRAPRGVRRTLPGHLPAHRGDLRHRSRRFWEERAARVGPEVLAWVQAVFDSDDVLTRLRCVQAAVTHLETFPRERARAACGRALAYGNLGYGSLKRILREGLDLQPLPRTTARRWLTAPRYSRDPRELLGSRNPTCHGHPR